MTGACVNHPGREATHRSRATAPVCGECAARIAARLNRERARRVPVAACLFGVAPGSDETGPEAGVNR